MQAPMELINLRCRLQGQVILIQEFLIKAFCFLGWINSKMPGKTPPALAVDPDDTPAIAKFCISLHG